MSQPGGLLVTGAIGLDLTRTTVQLDHHGGSFMLLGSLDALISNLLGFIDWLI